MTTPTPHIIGKFRSHQKILFALSKIINNCLGEEGAMGYRSYHFVFNNNGRFFIFCTKQNLCTEIMKLFHDEDVIFS